MKQVYVFSKTDKGYFGKAFELEIKRVLNRKNPSSVSPCGTADFRYHNKNYDSKQNGSVLQYNPNAPYIKGSNRVVFASHIDYTVINETETEIEFTVNLENTEMYVVDKKQFVNFLLENGYAKYNSKRGQINIQTCYNYKKDAYHGRIGKYIENWCYENEITDDFIIDDILTAVFNED